MTSTTSVVKDLGYLVFTINVVQQLTFPKIKQSTIQ